MTNFRKHPDNLTLVFFCIFLVQIAVVSISVLTCWAVTDYVQPATVKIGKNILQ